MTSAYDLVIRNGIVVDGSGGEPFAADVAIAHGRIAAVGRVTSAGAEEIDATDLLVTPGFVDIHTHYDGQATWSERLAPSSAHGVTTTVIGNCGVGFAPCRADDRAALVNVMEGVEDIPEAVMAEGLPWNWETFPQYLDALAARRWDVDVAAYIPHSPLRVYVMGQRGLAREPATAADLAHMSELVAEGMAAGALGVATSRTIFHRTGDGHFIPTFDADAQELEALAAAVGKTGRGVVQMIPNLDASRCEREMDLLVRVARASKRPVTFSLAQSHDEPDVWRRALDRVAQANANEGTQLRPQVFPRPMGAMLGLSTSLNPFSLCPGYGELATLPLEARVQAMRRPEIRERLLAEQKVATGSPLLASLRGFERMYPMAAVPTYEPSRAHSVQGLADARGMSAPALAYELLLEDDGCALIYMPFSNYAEPSLDPVLAMMRNEFSVIGLGDGGAHYGLICDASYPTTILAYWTRDRAGERVSIPWAVKALAADTAALVGLSDRGRIACGLKADINLIDYAALQMRRPRVVHDLPGGGRRMVQDVSGYRATIVSGEIVQRAGEATGATPGRLVRGR